MLMLFVRRGWEAGEGGPAVQRVGYRLADGQLERLAFAQVDGGGDAIVSPLLERGARRSPALSRRSRRLAAGLGRERRHAAAGRGRTGHAFARRTGWCATSSWSGARGEAAPPRRERGAALLAVLLLVAVTGAIAAVAIEKLRLSRAVAMNVVAVDQARAYARGVEQLGMLTIDDLIASNPERTTRPAAGDERSGAFRCRAAGSPRRGSATAAIAST